MNWKQKESKSSFLEDKIELFGTDKPAESRSSEQYKIRDIDKVSERIRRAHAANEFIHVTGDYDCDGVLALAEFELLFKAIGHDNYKLRPPKRLSEGYGLSFAIVEEILQYQPGLCILVDNGITAVEQVEKLINYGWDVIIMDHHQKPADGVLPPADIIIDPEAITGQADFSHYCGSGLVYKLACEMKIPDAYLDKILSYAAIATCADCVPLVDKNTKEYDNFLIVKNGIENISCDKGGKTKALYVLVRALGLDYHVTEEDFGYRIGPIINASGRLYDDGAKKVLDFFTNEDASFKELEILAEELIESNNKRKDVQKAVITKIKEKVQKPDANIMVIYEPDVPEGIVGLIAGDIEKDYRVPAVVFTDGKNGELKGSARSTDDVDIMGLIFACQGYLERCGGHPKAAGLGIKKENFIEFKRAIEKAAGPYEIKEDVVYFDYVIYPEEAQKVWGQMSMFAPYGEGNPRPIFMIPGYAIKHAGIIGATGSTLKMSCASAALDAINFTGLGVEKYQKVEHLSRANLIGSLNMNSWHGQTKLQITFSDMLVMTE